MTEKNKEPENQNYFPYAQVDICVWDDKRLSMLDKAVYTAICVIAAKGKSITPGTTVDLIIEQAGCARTSVIRASKNLDKLGYLKISWLFVNNAWVPAKYTIVGNQANSRICND